MCIRDRYYNRPNTSARVNLDYRLAQHSSLNFNYLLNATVDRMNQETSDETKGDGGSPDYLTRHFMNLSYDLDLDVYKRQVPYFTYSGQRIFLVGKLSFKRIA